DYFHALAVQFGDDLFCGVARALKFDIRAGSRSYFSLRQYKSEDSDLHAAKLAHDVPLGAAERLVGCCVDDIRCGPAKLRFIDALLQHVWSKVKLMVAERRVVETDRVPRLDHLLAFVSYRLHRRRNRVAGHQKQRVWVFLLDRLPQGQQTAESASRSLVDRRKLVDVVHLQQRHLDVALGFFLGRDRKDRCNKEDQGQRSAAREHQRRLHVFDLSNKFKPHKYRPYMSYRTYNFCGLNYTECF